MSHKAPETYFKIVLVLSQDVEPASPAALAGLQPNTDYIVGSDQILQEVECMFLKAVIVFLPSKCMLQDLASL